VDLAKKKASCRPDRGCITTGKKITLDDRKSALEGRKAWVEPPENQGFTGVMERDMNA